jgi:redox-sensitive bicupin YhaK (pirin superfamily)
MRIIHFTRGATDPLNSFDAKGVHFLPLADGSGDTHLSCLHLEEGATIEAPSITHTAALLVVHGRITITTHKILSKIQFLAGTAAVFDQDEPYSIASDVSSIVLIVESDELTPHARGISSPERIAGQTWPSDGVTV